MQGEQEDRAEQAEVHRGHRDAGAGEARVAEHVEVDHRLLRARFVGDEDPEDHHAGGNGRQRARRGPSVAAAADHAVDQGPEPDDRQERAREVEASVRRVARLGHHEHEPDQCEEDHGDVHEEDGSPVEVLEQHTAGQRPERDADPRGARPDRDRLLALHGLGEDVGDDRERRGEDQRGADPGHGAHGDERACGVDERGRGTPDAEHDEPEGEHPPSAEPVAEAPAREQEAGEHDRVGVDDPLELARRRGQRSGQRRDGDVEDRGVDGDEDERGAEHREGPPPAIVGTEGVRRCAAG